MPVDPVSEDTWIAVNDVALAAMLLNVCLGREGDGAAALRRSSRGRLAPRLMASVSFAEAERTMLAINGRDHPPFQLILINDRDLARFHSGGAALRHEHGPLDDRPHLFASSGLGDALVEGPRRQVFEQVFAPGCDWGSRQFAFHRHSWPDRKHLSVCMERDEARTVTALALPQRMTLAAVERGHILATLHQANWVIDGPAGAARILDLHSCSTPATRFRSARISWRNSSDRRHHHESAR